MRLDPAIQALLRGSSRWAPRRSIGTAPAITSRRLRRRTATRYRMDVALARAHSRDGRAIKTEFPAWWAAPAVHRTSLRTPAPTLRFGCLTRVATADGFR